VLVGGAQMPAEIELPPPIAALARRNAIELQDRRWHEDADALAEVLKGREREVAGNHVRARVAGRGSPGRGGG
jgi:hypothetical protein